MPRSRRSSAMCARTRTDTSGSSPSVGSSRKSSSGRSPAPWPAPRRCLRPVDSSLYWRAAVRSSARTARSARPRGGGAPDPTGRTAGRRTRTISSTRRLHRNDGRPLAMLRRRRRRAAPGRRRGPAPSPGRRRAVSSVARIDSSVVLPAPLGPSRPKMAPRSHRTASRRAGPPSRAGAASPSRNVFTTSRASTASMSSIVTRSMFAQSGAIETGRGASDDLRRMADLTPARTRSSHPSQRALLSRLRSLDIAAMDEVVGARRARQVHAPGLAAARGLGRRARVVGRHLREHREMRFTHLRRAPLTSTPTSAGSPAPRTSSRILAGKWP